MRTVVTCPLTVWTMVLVPIVVSRPEAEDELDGGGVVVEEEPLDVELALLVEPDEEEELDDGDVDDAEAGDEAACAVNVAAQAIEIPNTSAARVIPNKAMRHPPDKKEGAIITASRLLFISNRILDRKSTHRSASSTA